MRKKMVVGNWKMNGQKNSITKLLESLCQYLPEHTDTELVVLPPAIYLPLVSSFLSEKAIKWGAQNVYPAESGAFTGEIGLSMLQDYGCAYVLVGHSERRSIFAENEKFIRDKFHQIKEHGMIPVLCIGETADAREQGHAKDVIARQLQAVAQNNSQAFFNSVIAYEPVWAIGTGQTAHPELIQEVHSTIRALITELGEEKGQNVTLLYGGSLNEQNARSIFGMPDVDGGLIGGASLDARKFVEIVACIN